MGLETVWYSRKIYSVVFDKEAIRKNIYIGPEQNSQSQNFTTLHNVNQIGKKGNTSMSTPWSEEEETPSKQA